MSVVLADIETEPLAEAVETLEAAGARVLGVRTDVSKLDDVEALLDVVLARFGRVNVVCNNAGVAGSVQPTFLLNIDDWKWVLGVNLWGVIDGCHVFLPHLMSHGDGHIVNTASMAGLLSIPVPGPVQRHQARRRDPDGDDPAERRGGIHRRHHGPLPGFINTPLMSGDRNRPASLTAQPRPSGASDGAQAEFNRLSEGTRTGLSPDALADEVLMPRSSPTGSMSCPTPAAPKTFA